MTGQVKIDNSAYDQLPLEQLSGAPIRSITFTGKFRLRRYILYREIDSRPGTPLDLELLDRDRRKIDGFGIFSKVEPYVVPNGDSVDVGFELKEVWTLLPLVSIGTTDGKFDWSLGVHERDVLGFYMQAAILYRRYEGKNSGTVVISLPRFLGKDLAVAVAVSDQREIEPLSIHGQSFEYDYLHKAVSASIGHRLSEYLYVAVSAGYDRENWTLGTPDTLGLARSTIDYPRYFSAIGTTIGRVYYDRYFYLGNDASADIAVINEQPHGQFDKWRVSLTGRKYIIAEPFNLAMRLRYQSSSRDERVPPYSISGETNVRGFPDKVERGDFLVTGNLETRLRVIDSKLFYGQLAVFADYGSIWGREKSSGAAFKDPRWSVGFGIRGSIKSFLGRIGRLDLALNPDDGQWSLYLSTSQFF